MNFYCVPYYEFNFLRNRGKTVTVTHNFKPLNSLSLLLIYSYPGRKPEDLFLRDKTLHDSRLSMFVFKA